MPDLLEQLHDYADGLESCVRTATADEAMAASTIRAWRQDRAARRSRRMWFASAAAAVLVLVVVAGQLVAGGPIPFGASSDDVGLRDALVGRRFVVSSITEDGAPKVLVGPAVSGDPAIGVIRFARSGNPEDTSWWAPDDVSVSSTGGCNSTSATFEVVDGRLELAPEASMTLVGCDQPLLDQDQWLSTFLDGSPRIALDGERLTLTTATTTIELVERAEPPSPPPPAPAPVLTPADLDGRTFVATAGLVGGVERRIVGPADEPEPARLRLTFADGTVTATAGCSSGTGPYTLAMQRIEGLTITPAPGCPPALLDQDAWLNELFSTPPSIGVDGDYLTLGNQVDTIMVFVDESAEVPLVAPSPLAGTSWALDASASGIEVPSTLGSGATLVLGDGATPSVYVRDGCTIVTGRVDVDATTPTSGTISMHDLERIDASCPETTEPIVDLMTEIQTGTWSYAIDINRLTLTDGTRTVVFQTT